MIKPNVVVWVGPQVGALSDSFFKEVEYFYLDEIFPVDVPTTLRARHGERFCWGGFPSNIYLGRWVEYERRRQ